MELILRIIKNVYSSSYRPGNVPLDIWGSIADSVIICIQYVMAKCKHELFVWALQVCSTYWYLRYIGLSL